MSVEEEEVSFFSLSLCSEGLPVSSCLRPCEWTCILQSLFLSCSCFFSSTSDVSFLSLSSLFLMYLCSSSLFCFVAGLLSTNQASVLSPEQQLLQQQLFQQQQQQVNNRVYIGNVPFGFSSEDLKVWRMALFER